jgi:L-ascorbate metabolism protein UlaG (beta-lactamase superfamily)
MANEVFITHIDTACVLLEINGFKILTDPTLDNAGHLYHHGFGAMSRKTDNPAIAPEALKDIDLILLSHHQHKDNFDIQGKAFSKNVSTIVSTVPASKAIPGIIGLKEWETTSINTQKINNLKITATPAQHHPWWLPEFFSGKVIGFVIEFDGQENGVIYISGDTVYFKGIDEVAQRFKVDIGIFHVGSAQFRYLSGFGQYTMDSKDLLKAVDVIQPNTIVPIHYKGWTHFKETTSALTNAISANSTVKNKTKFLTSGVRTKLR